MQFVKDHIYIVLGILLLAAGVATAANLNTSGRCPGGTSCNIGESNTTDITLTTDGAGASLDTTANTFTLTATTTASATFAGADAAGAANTIYDTTSTGTVQVGSADVTAVTVVTDGGTVTVDGTVTAPLKVISLASGALTVNNTHIATATADYNLPDACDSATGNWVTIVVADASETISIGLTDTADTIFFSGITAVADDELDSPTAGATTPGSSITLACLETNNWFSIAAVGTWVDGGAAD